MTAKCKKLATDSQSWRAFALSSSTLDSPNTEALRGFPTIADEENERDMHSIQPKLTNNARRGLLLLGLITASLSAPAYAEDSSLSLHGFGTLGIARSSSDQAEFVRDLSQPQGVSNHWSGRIDSALGVQANWQATPTLELVGQAVSRYHYDRSRDPELMWAFAKWEPDARISLRAGRIGADFMMLADSRLVNYAFLTVRPSADFFGALFLSHFDGADASLTLPLRNGLLRGKLFAGATHEKSSGIAGIWDTSGSQLNGVVVDYQTGPWQLRASAASIRFSSDINLAPLPELLRAAGTSFGYPGALAAADRLRVKNTTSRYYSMGAVYDNGPLQIQGMLNRIEHQTGVFRDSHAGYLLAGYRLGTVTPFAGVSWWKTSASAGSTGLPESAPFAEINRAYASSLAVSVADQKTYTLGARWDVRQDMAVKVQWDAIRGSAASRFPVTNSKPDWNGRTNVLSLSLDFVF